jgi:adenine-specific DNA-methyltransferase
VKSNHVEKTGHPCQFPVELVERLVLALSGPDDWVCDPFLGTGTSIIAAIRNNRRGMGAELLPEYVKIASERIKQTLDGTLKVRTRGKAVFDPKDAGRTLITPPWLVREGDPGTGYIELPGLLTR